MAKSLRSKQRRKMRAIKRERYGEKELKRLKTMLEMHDGNTDVDMSDIAIVKNADEIKESSKSTDIIKTADENVISQGDHTASNETEMEHDQKRFYNKKTLRDQYGNYPVWFSRKQIRKMQDKDKITKKKKKAIGKRKKR